MHFKKWSGFLAHPVYTYCYTIRNTQSSDVNGNYCAYPRAMIGGK